MEDRVFLTEERRDILDGNDRGIKDESLTVAKSRIRKRTRVALAELTEVARSQEIDNADVFDPDDVYTLILSLIERGGLQTDEYEHVPDEYRDAIIARLATGIVEANRFDTDDSDE